MENTPADLLAEASDSLDVVSDSWWFSILAWLWDLLLLVGNYIFTHPVEAVVYAVVLMVALTIGRFIFSALWKIVFYVLLPLLIIGTVYVWWTQPNINNDLGDPFSVLINPELRAVLADREAKLFTPPEADQGVFTKLVKFSNLTSAPDFSLKTYEEGLDTLQEVAATWGGEVAYCHNIPTIGVEGRWLRGTYSKGLSIPFSNDCLDLIKNKDESPVRIVTFVHTHPKSIIPEGAKAPPSGQDVSSALYLLDEAEKYHLSPPYTFRMIIVESSRIWELIISPKVSRSYFELHQEKGLREVDEIVNELEPIYLCEALPDKTPEDCAPITLKQREQAVNRLLEIYTAWGISITETPRTPRGQAI